MLKSEAWGVGTATPAYARFLCTLSDKPDTRRGVEREVRVQTAVDLLIVTLLDPFGASVLKDPFSEDSFSACVLDPFRASVFDPFSASV